MLFQRPGPGARPKRAEDFTTLSAVPLSCCSQGHFSKRVEELLSSRHFFVVSLADSGTRIGLYVSDADPNCTILGAETPIEIFRLASPKALLAWLAMGCCPKGLRILRFRYCFPVHHGSTLQEPGPPGTQDWWLCK